MDRWAAPEPGVKLPSFRFAILAVLFLAAVVRLVTWTQVRETPVLYLHTWSEADQSYYHDWAKEIAGGDWLSAGTSPPYHRWHHEVAQEVLAARRVPLPYDEAAGRRVWAEWLGEKTFYQDPLLPYFIAAVYVVAGPWPPAVFLLQSLLGLASVALVMLFANLLFEERAVVLVAGVLAALFGPLIFYEFLLLRTALATFLALAALVIATVALKRPGSTLWALCAGAIAGLNALLRSEAVLLIALVAVVAIVTFRNQQPRGAGRRWLTRFAAGVSLAVLPLVARNLAVGAPALALPSEGTIAFISGNAADHVPGGGLPISRHSARLMEDSGGSLLAAIPATLATHDSTASFVRLIGRKFFHFWNRYEIPNNASYDYFLLFAPFLSRIAVDFALIAPLGVVGLLLAHRRTAAYRLALGFVLLGLFAGLAFFILARFRTPYAAALIPFAAYVPCAAWRALRSRHGWTVAGIAGLVALVAMFCLWPPAAGHGAIALADYGTGNEIAVHLVRRLDPESALAMLRRQLATEPAELRQLERAGESTVISELSASLAGSFAPLHDLAAGLCESAGNSVEAAFHARRAEVLGFVGRQYSNRKQFGSDL